MERSFSHLNNIVQKVVSGEKSFGKCIVCFYNEIRAWLGHMQKSKLAQKFNLSGQKFWKIKSTSDRPSNDTALTIKKQYNQNCNGKLNELVHFVKVEETARKGTKFLLKPYFHELCISAVYRIFPDKKIQGFIPNMWIKIPWLSLIGSQKHPLFPWPPFHIFKKRSKENWGQ